MKIEICGEVATPEFWLAKNPGGDEIIWSPSEIEKLNSKILNADDYAENILSYPEEISGADLKAKIRQLTDDVNLHDFKNLFLDSGEPVPEENFSSVRANENVEEIPPVVKIRYAVTTSRANVRILPESSGRFSPPLKYRFDELQATAVDPAEGVIVLHESADGNFFFAQTENYFGWIKKNDLAFVTRSEFENYVAPKKFLTVIANKKNIFAGGKNFLFQQGAKIPLDDSGKIRLPKNSNGRLAEIFIAPENDGTIENYLSCTQNNFIRQAFKFPGDPYGWGGLDDSVDCSAFVADVYKSMGIKIPRDADRQEICLPRVADLKNLNRDERLKKIFAAPPGSLLFKPGHVMMYLGQISGKPIVIHAATIKIPGTDERLHKVAVTELNYPGASVPTIDALTGIAFVKS